MKTHNCYAGMKAFLKPLYKNPDSDLLHYESEKCIVRALKEGRRLGRFQSLLAMIKECKM